jgi:hypothetical protein
MRRILWNNVIIACTLTQKDRYLETECSSSWGQLSSISFFINKNPFIQEVEPKKSLNLLFFCEVGTSNSKIILSAIFILRLEISLQGPLLET